MSQTNHTPLEEPVSPPGVEGQAETVIEFIPTPRAVLEALVASAKHATERRDLILGNTAETSVSWTCRADCHVCAARAVLDATTPVAP